MSKPTDNSTKYRPCLKWAGGKFRLIDTIRKHLPTGKRLIEPFAGSASICLNTHFPRYWLNDINPDLINLYRCLQTDVELFIQKTKPLFRPTNNTAERYYQLREKFNNTDDLFKRSCLFLYLNRHSYNGLCRYNLSGGFNAPFGRYVKPYFPIAELRQFAQQAKHMRLTNLSFEKVLQQAKAGDVVYCDPPYVPLTETANFTQYSQRQFNLAEQTDLAELAEQLVARNVYVVISNHNTPLTRKLYQSAKLVKFTVPRFISCNGQKRQPAKELLAIYS